MDRRATMMKNRFLFCIFMVGLSFVLSLNAQVIDTTIVVKGIEKTVQPSDSLFNDSISRMFESVLKTDEKLKDEKIVIGTETKAEFKPDPTRAVLYTLIFPGMGQIYNRKYWKLPIVYGGFIGITYAITWNGNIYHDYSNGYRDLVTGEGDSWKSLLSARTVQEIESDPSLKETYRATFKRKKDYYRRNRDLAVFAMVGLYALCMIDAYVDAQLYDFDVSPDLSMRVEPVVWGPDGRSNFAVGLQCSVRF